MRRKTIVGVILANHKVFCCVINPRLIRYESLVVVAQLALFQLSRPHLSPRPRHRTVGRASPPLSRGTSPPLSRGANTPRRYRPNFPCGRSNHAYHSETDARGFISHRCAIAINTSGPLLFLEREQSLTNLIQAKEGEKPSTAISNQIPIN